MMLVSCASLTVRLCLRRCFRSRSRFIFDLSDILDLLAVVFRRDQRIEVRDDVFAGVFSERLHALVSAFAVALDLDQQGVSSAQHVGDDARRPDPLGRIVLVECQLGVASADIQDR